MSITKTWPGGSTNETPDSYRIPEAGETNWADLSDFLVALANGAQSTTFQKYAVRKPTTTPVTVSASSDCVVVTDLSVAGAVTVNLPAGANKQMFIIADGKGDAKTNNITITPNGAETIAGSSSLVLNTNRESVMLVYNSADTDWKIAAQSIPNPTGTDIGGFTANRAIISDVSGNLAVSSTTSTQIGYLSGAAGTTGTNNLVYSNSPTLVTPSLGTPSAAVLTNATGLPLSTGVTGTLPVANGGTGSASALSNNKLMYSFFGTIVEYPAPVGNRALISLGNGLPTNALTTDVELNYVSGVTSSIQTQLNGKEPTFTILPIAKGGTNSGTALNNNRVMQSSGGGIIEAAAITASRALVSDANGIPVAATTTATEIGYVNGVTSAIQTQIDAKQARSTLTTKGDLYVATASATVTRQAVGADGTVLTADSAQSTGMKWASVLVNPMTTTGDIIYSSDNSGTAARLGIGASGTVLHGGTTPSYSQIVNADVSSSAAIAFSKLATLSSGNIILGSAGGVATSTAVTGDVTISNTGVTAIASGVIVNGDVNASAAIDGTKISPNFGSQTVQSTGAGNFGSSTITGDLTVDTTTLKVDSTNNRVGVGIASPTSTLHVSAGGTTNASSNAINAVSNSTSTSVIAVSADSASFVAAVSGIYSRRAVSNAFSFLTCVAGDNTNYNVTSVFNVQGDGVVFIRSAAWGTGGTAVGISGNLLTTSPSSLRYKENIQDLATEIDCSLVYDLRPVVFDYIEEKGGYHSFGLIAEEVFSILPCLVHLEKNDAGTLQPESVDYSHITILLLEELKKLKARVEDLERIKT